MTWYGGGGKCFDGNGHGCGTVFEMTPKAGGGWSEKILYSFNGSGSDGIWPSASLIFDGSGNLYGVNFEGGVGSYGTVFELTPKAGGGWTEEILHSFNGNGKDGNNPSASLIFDASGNLYGTTYDGPPQGYGNPCNDGKDLGCGTAFELMPKAGGEWTEEILHRFSTNNGDGFNPSASLIFDASGNPYSTTYGGGALGAGTAFELTPKAGGHWTEKLLYSFGKDGFYPDALIFDAAGNLYGTTEYGGNSSCENGGQSSCGTVFEITP